MRNIGIDLVTIVEVVYKGNTMDGYGLTTDLRDTSIQWDSERGWEGYAQDVVKCIDDDGDIAEDWEYAVVYLPDIDYRGLGVHFKKVIVYPDGFTEMEIIK